MGLLRTALAAPDRAALAAMSAEQREKEDSSRVTRQRPILRVCSELALVGIIRDAPDRSGGEWIMKVMKELVCLSCSFLHSKTGANTRHIAFQRPDAIVIAIALYVFEVLRISIFGTCSLF